jgi:hypothetical protein
VPSSGSTHHLPKIKQSDEGEQQSAPRLESSVPDDLQDAQDLTDCDQPVIVTPGDGFGADHGVGREEASGCRVKDSAERPDKFQGDRRHI